MSQERRRALVVDDDEEVRNLVLEYLEVSGFEVLKAENGLEALLKVKHERPEVVVIDVHMPRLGGLEALKRIRAFDASIRVVVISGRAAEVERDALRLGAHAVLPKPLVLPDLSRALGAEVVAAPVAAATGAAASVVSAPAVARTDPRILLVDDDAGVREMLQELMTATGCQTHAAADGAAALRAVVTTPCDVILLDIDMPGLSGLETLVAIRALVPDVPVVMVSGIESEEVARSALAKGAFDYIMKPIDVQRLTSVVDAALSFRTR